MLQVGKYKSTAVLFGTPAQFHSAHHRDVFN